MLTPACNLKKLSLCCLLIAVSTSYGMRRVPQMAAKALTSAAKPKSFGSLKTPAALTYANANDLRRIKVAAAEEKFARKFASLSQYAANTSMHIAPMTEGKAAAQLATTTSLSEATKQALLVWLKQNTFDANETTKLLAALTLMQNDPEFAQQVFEMAKEQASTLTEEQKEQLNTLLNDANKDLSKEEKIIGIICSLICLPIALKLCIWVAEEITGNEDLEHEARVRIKGLFDCKASNEEQKQATESMQKHRHEWYYPGQH